MKKKLTAFTLAMAMTMSLAGCAQQETAPEEQETAGVAVQVVEVTAACAMSPANLPTTTTSAALNSSCSRLAIIMGMAKRMILPASGPLIISI